MSQSKALKLPSLDLYSPRQPMKLNPSYRLKYQNPLRVRYIRFLNETDLKETETFYLQNYAKTYNIPVANTYRAIATKPKEEKKIIRYKKPNFQYFKEDDSDVDEALVKKVMHLKQARKSNKIFISE